MYAQADEALLSKVKLGWQKCQWTWSNILTWDMDYEKTRIWGLAEYCQSRASLQWSYKNREDSWNNYLFFSVSNSTCLSEFQPFRLKLEVSQAVRSLLLHVESFGREGESRNIGSHLHRRRCDYLTAPSSLFMGQTSQTAFATPFESFVSSTVTFPCFEADVHHSPQFGNRGVGWM